MAVTLNPYLNFRDEARAAMAFYQSVFGGELTTSTFGEAQASEDPADRDKIMHAQLMTRSGFTLMGADTPSFMGHQERHNGAISLSGPADDEQELHGYWSKLSDGGKVTVPLEKAPWGDQFGMCSDRFGVEWMVNIAGS